MANVKELENYIRAGYPAIILKTAEEDRALTECKKIAQRLGKEFSFWSFTRGEKKDIKDYDAMSSGALAKEIENELKDKNQLIDPIQVLENPMKKITTAGKVYVLLDFHPYIKAPNSWRRAKDLFKIAKSSGITYVFVSSEFEVPVELKREVIITTLPLPSREEISATLEKMAKAYDIALPEDIDPYVEAALGLTIAEAENAYATSLAAEGKFDVRCVSRVKEQTICNGGLIECKSSNEELGSIGGLKNFKNWAQKRFSAFSKEAKEYGIPAPKGTLLIGVPGSGKSLSAKALANLWQKPLLKLDIGKLFGSLVGATESNTRQALALTEAMAPCVLWIDEIEKGLAGLESSGKTDSGVTSRAFGTILTWLQEKEAPVFVIATANNVAQLPPEFLRKGRFDEIFFVDIPSENERKEIFEIQLKKHGRNPEEFDINALAEKSEHFTGAEIEQAIINALFNTFNSENRVLTTQSVIEAIEDINPMAGSGSMSNQIEAIRRWAEDAKIQKANSISEELIEGKEKIGRVIMPTVKIEGEE